MIGDLYTATGIISLLPLSKQLLYRFLANGHLLRVSRQSLQAADDKGVVILGASGYWLGTRAGAGGTATVA